MRPGFAAASLALMVCGAAYGHRLDEYLQATTISIGKDRVVAQIDLTPGVAVFRHVMAAIDADRDGVVSPAEQQAYAGRVLADVSLSIDGAPVRPKLTSVRFPEVEQMKEGLGEIQVGFAAEVPPGHRERRLVFENHHQSTLAAYMVNCLAPAGVDIRVTKQSRNYEQSRYQLDYFQNGDSPGPASLAWWSGSRVLTGGVGLLLAARLASLWRARSAIA